MRIKKTVASHVAEHNREFTSLSQVAIGTLLQTQDETPLGYVPSLKELDPPHDWRPDPAVSALVLAEQPSMNAKRSLEIERLAEYERVVASALLYGGFHTYVLVGDLGSGKTALMKHLRDFISAPRSEVCSVCAVCNPIVIYLNFNEGFNDQDTKATLENFRAVLGEKLRKALRQVFRENALTDRFIDASTEPGRYDGFDGLAQKREDRLQRWQEYNNASRTNKLFSYIDEGHSLSRRLELLMHLVRFVRDELRPDPGCFVFLFDNLDSVTPEAQYDLLLELLSLQAIAKVRSLVALRRSTFGRLRNQGAYSFGVINHRGPGLAQVLRLRLEHFESNWPYAESVRQLRPQHRDALRRRLQYILKHFDDRRSIVNRAEALTGSSVRAGLTLMERAFNTSQLPYDDDPTHLDDLMRGVLIGQSETGTLDPNDKLVPNVFVDDPRVGNVSLAPLRLLTLIRQHHQRGQSRPLAHYVVLMTAHMEIDRSEIQSIVNYLLRVRRPVLWIDGRSEYSRPDELVNSDDVPYLTKLGEKILDEITQDLVYVQESLMSVEWPDAAGLPPSVKYDSMSDRFRVVRGFLSALFHLDASQAQRFSRWLVERPSSVTATVSLVTQPIIVAIAESVLQIMIHSAQRSPDVQSELSNWLSLLLLLETEADQLRILAPATSRLRARYEAVCSDRP